MRSRRKSRAFLATILLAPAVVLVLGAGTSARFSDVETSRKGELSIGVLDVGLPEGVVFPDGVIDDSPLDGDGSELSPPDSNDEEPASPVTSTPPPLPELPPGAVEAVSPLLVTFANIAPGDHVVRELEVRNSGSTTVRFSLVLAASGETFLDLLGVDAVSSSCADASWPVSEPVPGTVRGLGDPAPGQHEGDRVIEPESTQFVCLRYVVSIDMSDEFQGASASHEVVAYSEQAG